jgi:heterodisulfide reductase subunit A
MTAQDLNPATVVIGGGIAGIQASLEIADAGFKVYLVERTGTIGGYMATFDKTFPTLDCAACILTPKMVEVAQHKNIELLSYSEVKAIEGSPGNFRVTLLKKARYVNLSTCIACGQCSEKCPVRVESEFDSCVSQRKSIYIPFPQAVPNKYLIDKDSCTYLKSKKCGVCAKICPVPGCIDYEDKDREMEVTAGNIIITTGYKPFDAGRIARYGYGRFPNVVTSLEFERLVNAAGPTGGAIVLKAKDKKGRMVFQAGNPEPGSVAIIHCVGSRDENYNKYCSRVCCMYSLKLAHLVAEKLPKARVYQYYIDLRAAGKGYEEFSNRIKHEGVHLVRGRTAKVEEKEGKLCLRSEDILAGKLIDQTVDMVVLAVGLEPREDAGALAKMACIPRGEAGWFTEADSLGCTTATVRNGVSIAGACQGPKDIPDTVAQASAAASRVLQNLIRGRIEETMTAGKQ